MKNRIATIMLVALLGLTGMGLTACGENPNADYTGDATASKVYYRSASKHGTSKCFVTVAFPDGNTHRQQVKFEGITFKASKRSKCKNIKVDGKVSLQDGKIISYEVNSK